MKSRVVVVVIGIFALRVVGGAGQTVSATVSVAGDLYVTENASDTVVRFDGNTGNPIGTFALGGGGGKPGWLACAPNGNLLMTRQASHNVIEFDLRFLKQRAIVNNIRPPFIIPADAKHGSAQVFDTMKAWAGWKGYVSQEALCEALGIDGKAGMTGADVWPAYQRGEYETIEEYNRDDVRIVRELFKRMS